MLLWFFLERHREKDTRNLFMETNLSLDNWQEERNSSSSQQDDRKMSQFGATYYSIPDNLGNEIKTIVCLTSVLKCIS